MAILEVVGLRPQFAAFAPNCTTAECAGFVVDHDVKRWTFITESIAPEI